MDPTTLRTLLDGIRDGSLTVEAAHARLTGALRDAPFEDLGFARIDHHRAVRQGMPEVVFGQGKTPAQVAEISARIVAKGHNLLVTRADRDVWAAVQERLPRAVLHDTARAFSSPAPAPLTCRSPRRPRSRPKPSGTTWTGCSTSASPASTGSSKPGLGSTPPVC
jgi:NCAIR mutase (PurE)-related protein